MGNSTSEKPPLPSQLQQATDSRYGGTIMLDKNKTKAYQILDLDHNNVQYFSKLLNMRRQLQHSNLIRVNRTWLDDYRENCSFQKMHRATVEYLYIPDCLQDQIKAYCEQRRPVPQVLIRKYFTGVVSCLQYLRCKGTCHGDIKPKNILISKDKNAYLADSFFMNSGRIAFQIVMEDPESLSLLSPSQLQSLKNQKFVSLKQIHEDQMFAIGLSMMETMTAEPAMQCYDLANLKLKPQYFNRKYAQMTACDYSPQLCQLAMACVQFSPEKRIKFSQYLLTINSIPPNNHPVHTSSAVISSHNPPFNQNIPQQNPNINGVHNIHNPLLANPNIPPINNPNNTPQNIQRVIQFNNHSQPSSSHNLISPISQNQSMPVINNTMNNNNSNSVNMVQIR